MPVLTTKIKEYRVKRGMSQEQLAELAGVRRETISRLEKGIYNPSLKLAMDISRILDGDIYDLFSFEEEAGEEVQQIV